MTDPGDGRRAPAGDIGVRDIADADHGRVGRLLVDAYDRAGPFDDAYRRRLADPARWVPGASRVFVAEDGPGGPVLGVVALTRPGDAEFERFEPPVADCGFRFLAVAPAAQGRGVGRALVGRCLQAARRAGCHRMVIHSMAFMERAHRLYDRLGFHRRPDLDVTFPSGVGLAFALDLTDRAADRFPPPGPVPDDPPWFEDVMALPA